MSELEQLKKRNAELEAALAEHRKVLAALEESQERLRVLFELAPDGYYLNDLEGNFVDGNRAAEELIGYQREELIGKNFLRLSLLKLKDIPRAAKLLALNAVGQPTGPDTFTLTRKDGTDVVVEILTHPVTIAGKRLVAAIARDLTARKKAEEALHRARRELEMRTAERTAEPAATDEQQNRRSWRTKH